MADRYRSKPFPRDNEYDSGGDPYAPAKGDSDPLAELARLIGQTDPFAMGRANAPVQPRRAVREEHQEHQEYHEEHQEYHEEHQEYQEPAAPDDEPPAGTPPWMQRAAPQPQEAPQPPAMHPLRRYATPLTAPAPDYHQAQPFADAEQEPDPSRYDEALYGELDPGAEEPVHDPAYPDDPYYAYQDGEEPEESVRKRGGGVVTLVMVLALAVIGTGAAFAYRTYVGSVRSGEPPIIKADNSPTKIVPASADANIKVADRMAVGDGTEKIVPREEAPVDLNAQSGPRVVLAPMNPNRPPTGNAAPANPPPAIVTNGTMSNTEPHKIKTLTVRGDEPDAAATPVTSAPTASAPVTAKPAPAARTAAPAAAASRNPPLSANASANAPLSLSPQAAPAADTRTRFAANNPAQVVPSAPAAGGMYMVQVSSQRNESDAQASYKALQGKFPTVLGSHAPVIKRADLGNKGVYYRAMVGPFGTPGEASQFCGSLKTAGGQCVVQRN
jgi:SPOR domain